MRIPCSPRLKCPTAALAFAPLSSVTTHSRFGHRRSSAYTNGRGAWLLRLSRTIRYITVQHVLRLRARNERCSWSDKHDEEFWKCGKARCGCQSSGSPAGEGMDGPARWNQYSTAPIILLSWETRAVRHHACDAGGSLPSPPALRPRVAHAPSQPWIPGSAHRSRT